MLKNVAVMQTASHTLYVYVKICFSHLLHQQVLVGVGASENVHATVHQLRHIGDVTRHVAMMNVTLILEMYHLHVRLTLILEIHVTGMICRIALLHVHLACLR